ncbi:MAG TPA: PP2C family protein-serine/threonine phosphatase [Candidatus Polarisedimenticolaceae bacterium]|nr:PP2C family protein-serine/threonine phosphatase [Candidatus Polarisedimenticolaceae bacterium]
MDPETKNRRIADRKPPVEAERRPQSLSKIVFEDLREVSLKGTFREGLREIYRFYLDEDHRAEVEQMGAVRRAFVVTGWLIRGLLLKLSPPRRLLLLISAALVVFGDTIAFKWKAAQVVVDLQPWGYLLLLFVLTLELKDKLLARDEIEIARQVQRALLPTDPPAAAGWSIWGYTRPANDVGGDLVDYLRTGSGHVGIALGDVAGKGLGAALLMAKLQATLRAVASDHPDLDRLGQRLNAVLVQDGLPNRYATLFYAEVEPGGGALRYLNAGHNPPLLARWSGIEELGASSYPLGMLDDVAYRQGELDLRPGEMLVAYSDGLTEARNPAGEEFGLDRLRQALGRLRNLPAEEAGRSLLREVDLFMGEQRLDDDLSLVVLLRQGGIG